MHLNVSDSAATADLPATSRRPSATRGGIAAALLFAALLQSPISALAVEQPASGILGTIAELPINPGNLSVTTGRQVFATLHQFRTADSEGVSGR